MQQQDKTTIIRLVELSLSLYIFIYLFISPNEQRSVRGGGGGALPDFLFCSPFPVQDHERDCCFSLILCQSLGCLPAGVDPNRGSEETVRSSGVLSPANGISDVVGGALSV